jgi:hypothetical protein
MTLGMTRSLTEKGTKGISRGLRQPVGRAENLSLSYANCLKILDPQLSRTLRVCPGLYMSNITFVKNGKNTGLVTVLP